MAKLNVTGTVGEALRGTIAHFGDMVRLVWLPGILYIGLGAAISLLQMQERYGLAGLLNILTIFIWPIIAVAWHRFIILGESTPGSYYFAFGRREALYLIVSILLGLLLAPGVLIAAAAGALAEGGNAAGGLLMLVALIALGGGIFYMVRLLPLLPAVALDRPINARDILQMTEGNFWRLFAVVLLVGIIMLVIFIVLGLVFALFPLALVVLYPLVVIFSSIVGVAILSIAYRELSGGSAAPPAPPEPQLQ